MVIYIFFMFYSSKTQSTCQALNNIVKRGEIVAEVSSLSRAHLDLLDPFFST